MKDFKISAREVIEEEEGEELALPSIEFSIGGIGEYTGYRPTEGQVALLMSSGSDPEMSDVMAGLMTFFKGILDRKSYLAIRARLNLNEDDPAALGMANLQEFIEGYLEEWVGRPTKLPTDYMRSQRPGGQRSTGRAPGKGSTRSSSPRTAS
jgi:hypothetical protein